MTYRGRVQGNTIILDEPTGLPDGTVVEVEALSAQDQMTPTFLETMEKFAGCMEGLPEDLAENHDHYIHGSPKRVP